jgi:quinol monooxygenase YgiN
MGIKVIVELQAIPGGRPALVAFMDDLVGQHGGSQKGFRGSTRYEVPENPDLLVEIADWDSAEDRLAHMREAAASGIYAPLSGLLAAAPRVTVIRPLSPWPSHLARSGAP